MHELDVAGFLRRVGIADAEPPSVDALHRLHRAFAEHVPYETVAIQLGHPTTVDPLESADRIVRRDRGGYCFHLNGALAALLTALGYRVTMHRAGIQMSPDHERVITGNHLVLTVDGLSDTPWMVDVGLGDGLHSPLPLVEGAYQQGPFTFHLRPSEVVPGWRFDHDPRGSLYGLDFLAEPARITDFAERHEFLSTSPESSFVGTLGVLRTDADGFDVLRALTLSRIGQTTTRTVLEHRSDWFAALADVYGLTLADLSTEDRERLWRKVVGQHEEFLARTSAVDGSLLERSSG